MSNIIFHTDTLNERGTTVSLYDYAYYVREYLNLNPIIPIDLTKDNNPITVDKFKKDFDTFEHTNLSEIQTLVDAKGIEYFYAIKYGYPDGIVMQNTRNLIHSVFVSDASQRHGDAYAVISEWMSLHTGGGLPWVPFMINLPQYESDYRQSFSIPKSAAVIGRYGGYETFNIPFVWNSIEKILQERDDIWFLFMNTPEEIKHERCLYFEPEIDLNCKVGFINTCDAMLHARDYGETFGAAVLEFAAKNKQIISYDNEELQNNHPLGGRSHFLYLKDNCFKYQNENDLNQILLNITRENPFNTLYLNDEFSPKNVISKFKEVFL
jgi:hypothetical protein